MTTQEVADKLVAHGRNQRWDLAQEELYAEQAVSIEMEGAQGFPHLVKGMEAIKKKGEMWQDIVQEYHGTEIEGPIVAGDHFTCVFKMDVTMKGAPRKVDEEIAVYQVKDGKIISEQFFYAL